MRGLPDYDCVIVISGSREATKEQCERYVLPELKKITERCQSGVSVLIVHGDCPGKAGKPGGVDAYVKQWLEHAKVNLPTLDEFAIPYPSGHGRVGGPKRNRFMLMGRCCWHIGRSFFGFGGNHERISDVENLDRWTLGTLVQRKA